MPGLKTIYDRNGTALTDIRTAVTRSSLLNDIGEAVFSIPTSSVKCKEEYLRFGNYLYCENDELPDWVGIIDTPRTWKNGYVECHAFEVPFILQYRMPILNSTLSGAPGDRFRQLIDYANSKGDTLLRVGYVGAGGNDGSETLSDTTYAHLKSLAATFGFDWICTPVLSVDGRLTVTIDWLPTGSNPTDLELSQGHNILYGDMPLEESGELLNSVEGVSEVQIEEGTTSQLTATYSELSSVGLRESRVSFSNITEITTLTDNCMAIVKKQILPAYGTPLTVVNKGSTFSNIALRNIARYRYNNVGFTGSGLGMSQDVRIEGWLFNEAIGTVELFTGQVAA